MTAEVELLVVGTGVGEFGEGRILNRTIRVTPDGWEYEADPQHVAKIVQELGLTAANGVKSPGAVSKTWEEEENEDRNKIHFHGVIWRDEHFRHHHI